MIELLIVVAIIGIVAAIAIPNLMVAYQKGRQKVTMGDMRNLGAGIASYTIDHSLVPQVPSGDISVLEPFLVSFFMEVYPRFDGWGTPFRWEYVVNQSDDYSIVSYGRNRVAGGPAGNPISGNTYIVDSLSDFDNDLVYSNGTFTFSPRK